MDEWTKAQKAVAMAVALEAVTTCGVTTERGQT